MKYKIFILFLLFCTGLSGVDYRVRGNVEPDDRQEVEEILEGVERRFLATFKLDNNFRLTVYVCVDLQEFLRMTGASRWNGGHFRERTIYLQRLTVLRERGILARTLTHEFLHYCIWRTAGKGCPVWLNEGLVLNLSEEMRMLDCSRSGASFPVKELGALIRGKDRAKAKQAYCQSGELVNKLLKKYGFEKILDSLKRLKAGDRKALDKLLPNHSM